MKKLVFILLAVGLPLAVTGLANPSGATINGWLAAPALALGAFVIPVSYTHLRAHET